MKQEAIKDLSIDQLTDQLIVERKNHMEARFQHSSGQLENPSLLRKTKRTIARLKTEIQVRLKAKEGATDA